jgi:hypothetical protein
VAGSAPQFGDTNGTGAAASFYLPAGLAMDAGGNVYVADAFDQVIRKVAPGGVASAVAGNGGYVGAVGWVGS